MRLDGYRNIFARLPDGVKAADAHYEASCIQTVSGTGHKMTEASSRRKIAVYVRATGRSTGITYSEKLSDAPAELLERARLASLYTYPGKPDYPCAEEGDYDEGREAETGSELGSLRPLAADIAGAITGALHSGAYLAAIQLQRCDQYDEVANSKGLISNRRNGYCSLETQILAERRGVIGEAAVSLLFDPARMPELAAMAAEASDTAARLATPGSVGTGRYDIVLSPGATIDLMYCLGNAVNGYRSAGKGSCFADRAGVRVAGDAVTLLDSGYDKGCPMRFNIDNEGAPVSETEVVSRGRFTGLLHNSATAAAAGVSSTGNAGRRMTLSGSVQVQLAVTPKVLRFLPGRKSLAQLLSEPGNGLYITALLDNMHGFDYASGDFAVPVSAVTFRGGELTSGAGNLLWNGNLVDLLGGIAEVGRETRFATFEHSYALGGQPVLIREQRISGS